jgi:hypothetical protein
VSAMPPGVPGSGRGRGRGTGRGRGGGRGPGRPRGNGKRTRAERDAGSSFESNPSDEEDLGSSPLRKIRLTDLMGTAEPVSGSSGSSGSSGGSAGRGASSSSSSSGDIGSSAADSASAWVYPDPYRDYTPAELERLLTNYLPAVTAECERPAKGDGRTMWRFTPEEHTLIKQLHNKYRKSYSGKQLFSLIQVLGWSVFHRNAPFRSTSRLQQYALRGGFSHARKGTGEGTAVPVRPPVPLFVSMQRIPLPGKKVRALARGRWRTEASTANEAEAQAGAEAGAAADAPDAHANAGSKVKAKAKSPSAVGSATKSGRQTRQLASSIQAALDMDTEPEEEDDGGGGDDSDDGGGGGGGGSSSSVRGFRPGSREFLLSVTGRFPISTGTRAGSSGGSTISLPFAPASMRTSNKDAAARQRMLDTLAGVQLVIKSGSIDISSEQRMTDDEADAVHRALQYILPDAIGVSEKFRTTARWCFENDAPTGSSAISISSTAGNVWSRAPASSLSSSSASASAAAPLPPPAAPLPPPAFPGMSPPDFMSHSGGYGGYNSGFPGPSAGGISLAPFMQPYPSPFGTSSSSSSSSSSAAATAAEPSSGPAHAMPSLSAAHPSAQYPLLYQPPQQQPQPPAVHAPVWV